jgi:hypothetical protein
LGGADSLGGAGSPGDTEFLGGTFLGGTVGSGSKVPSTGLPTASGIAAIMTMVHRFFRYANHNMDSLTCGPTGGTRPKFPG